MYSVLFNDYIRNLILKSNDPAYDNFKNLINEEWIQDNYIKFIINEKYLNSSEVKNKINDYHEAMITSRYLANKLYSLVDLQFIQNENIKNIIIGKINHQN